MSETKTLAEATSWAKGYIYGLSFLDEEGDTDSWVSICSNWDLHVYLDLYGNIDYSIHPVVNGNTSMNEVFPGID